MTDIEKQALALLQECGWGGAHLKRTWNPRYEALCRAIEQHEAFRQEVSDAVTDYFGAHLAAEDGSDKLASFIIAKPVDPFVALVGEAVWNDPNEPDAVDCAASILAALAARGLEIREVGHD